MKAPRHRHFLLFLPAVMLGVLSLSALAGAETSASNATASPSSMATPLLDHWTRVAHPSTALAQVIWTGQQFVAAGGSTVLNSPDGVTWIEHHIQPAVQLFDITTNGSLFVAVGDNGVVVTSPDLNAWTTRAEGDDRPLHSVFWNGRDFLALGTRGAVTHSTDGVLWTYDTLPNNPFLEHGVWANGQLVVGAQNGIWLYRYMTTSSATYDKTLNGAGQINDIAWGNNLYVAVGENANLHTSPDGINWRKQSLGVATDLHGAVWTGKQFVVVGDYGSIFASQDGTTWQSIASGLTVSLHSVAYNGQRLVATGADGSVFISGLAGESSPTAAAAVAPGPTGPPTYTSASLALLDSPGQSAPAPPPATGTAGPFDRWTLISVGETSAFYGVRWMANQFVAVGQHNILTSPDGITWKSPGASLSGTFYDVATNGKIFVAVGDKGGLATSPDLKNWTSQTSPTPGRIYGIYWFNGEFLAVGDSGATFASSDGVAWATRQLGGSYFHHGTVAGSNLVVTDSDGITTTDGLNRRHISSSARMLDVAYSGNLLVAVGSGPDSIWLSSDGLYWQRSTSGIADGLAAVTWTGTQFVAAGGNTTILSSPDGQGWSPRSLGSKSTIYAVAGHGDNVVAVTSSGEIFTNQSVASVASPEIIFAPGPAGSVPQLELKCATADAKIFYTEDGSDPTSHSTPYTAPFSPARAETIKVRAFKDGLAPSAISSANFIVNSP